MQQVMSVPQPSPVAKISSTELPGKLRRQLGHGLQVLDQVMLDPSAVLGMGEILTHITPQSVDSGIRNPGRCFRILLGPFLNWDAGYVVAHVNFRLPAPDRSPFLPNRSPSLP